MRFSEEYPESRCSCKACQKMCKYGFPCKGTPRQIKKIIDAGYGDRLMVLDREPEIGFSLETYEDVPASQPRFRKSIYMLMPAIVGWEGRLFTFDTVARTCAFLENGRCLINDLKPIEGKRIDHDSKYDGERIRRLCFFLWAGDEGKKILKEWKKKNGKTNKRNRHDPRRTARNDEE